MLAGRRRRPVKRAPDPPQPGLHVGQLPAGRRRPADPGARARGPKPAAPCRRGVAGRQGHGGPASGAACGAAGAHPLPGGRNRPELVPGGRHPHREGAGAGWGRGLPGGQRGPAGGGGRRGGAASGRLAGLECRSRSRLPTADHWHSPTRTIEHNSRRAVAPVPATRRGRNRSTITTSDLEKRHPIQRLPEAHPDRKVAHRVDEDHPWATPTLGELQLGRVHGDAEAGSAGPRVAVMLVLGLAHRFQPRGQREGIAVVAALRDPVATSHGVPGGPGPFDCAPVAHVSHRPASAPDSLGCR
jgi:hypothetical protein